MNEQCQSEKTSVGGMLCLGYVVGIADVMTFSHFEVARACIPQGVAAGQLSAIAKQYLANHPEQWHFNASGLAASALQEAFPCK